MARGVAVTLLLLTLGASPNSDWRVQLRRYGPVVFGARFEEACKSLDPATCTAVGVNEECRHWTPFGDESQVTFMVENGRVMRVDVLEPGIPTQSGVGVGSTEEEVTRAYPGRITVTPHKYEPAPSRYLTYTPENPDDARFRIIFESDGSKVTRFRAGRLPAVEYVEGCL